MHSYKTLAGPAMARLVEKKSEFIAQAAPVAAEAEALAFLEGVRAEHRTASHNVYAYSLRAEARQRYSDDGEPAKTAGLPVLEVLTHADVVDCIVVVTRYFGGTLLGTGGLVRAYTGAAQAALAKATIVTVQRCVALSLEVPYAQYEPARRILEEAGAKLDDPLFLENVRLRATLPEGDEQNVLPALDELCRGRANTRVSDAFYTPF